MMFGTDVVFLFATFTTSNLYYSSKHLCSISEQYGCVVREPEVLGSIFGPVILSDHSDVFHSSHTSK